MAVVVVSIIGFDPLNTSVKEIVKKALAEHYKLNNLGPTSFAVTGEDLSSNTVDLEQIALIEEK